LGVICDCGVLNSQGCAEEGGQKRERDLHLLVTWFAKWRGWSSLVLAIYTASPILFTRVVYTLRDMQGNRPEDRRVSFRLWRQSLRGRRCATHTLLIDRCRTFIDCPAIFGQVDRLE
jgi:hypothetical protein